MKDLSNLSPNKGSNKTNKRLGRGIGSGLGKTAGKGHKGQKARKGGGIRAGFEGGQTPLYRRLPKVGFINPFPNDYSIVNLDDLNKFDAGTEINVALLLKAGLVKKKALKLKILGMGKLEKALTIKANKFSASAKAAIQAAGGKAEEI
ncbi:MAG: 50S ribosomal protein L15 [Oligoflexales bacterium]|nr:50S ribosomal protein L15 [Oligoflexales bacterium]